MELGSVTLKINNRDQHTLQVELEGLGDTSVTVTGCSNDSEPESQ